MDSLVKGAPRSRHKSVWLHVNHLFDIIQCRSLHIRDAFTYSLAVRLDRDLQRVEVQSTGNGYGIVLGEEKKLSHYWSLQVPVFVHAPADSSRHAG